MEKLERGWEGCGRDKDGDVAKQSGSSINHMQPDNKRDQACSDDGMGRFL